MDFINAGRLKVILSEHELPPRKTNSVTPEYVGGHPCRTEYYRSDGLSVVEKLW
jgi:hypothetical protein